MNDFKRTKIAKTEWTAVHTDENTRLLANAAGVIVGTADGIMKGKTRDGWKVADLNERTLGEVRSLTDAVSLLIHPAPQVTADVPEDGTEEVPNIETDLPDAEPAAEETPAEEPAEAEEHDHEAVAAQIAAEVTNGKGTPIRVAAGLLGALADLAGDESLTEEEAALYARLEAADVRADGSVRIPMSVDEMNTLSAWASDYEDDGGNPSGNRSAARALVKWIGKQVKAAA